jgi:regulator of PEP synthase PpsR (kinase-PPPase family)
VIEISDLAIEETAGRIIRLIEQRRANAPKEARAS